MKYLRYLLVASAVSTFGAELVSPAQQQQPVAIKGATVLTMTGPPIENGTVVISGGKIVAVGANVQIPSGAEVVDATGKYVMPGIVDARTSIYVDLNEASDPMTPQLRAIESFNPFGTFGQGRPGPLRLTEPLSGGVTTMYVGPADSAVIGGLGAVVKTAGPNLESLIIREPAGMNVALGEPPKKAARPKNRDPYTRMAEVAMTRQMLVKAQEYERAHKVNPSAPRDLGMEALGKVLRREMPARIQVNSAGDIRSALSLAKEFGLDVIIDGGNAAAEYTSELVARKIPVVIGQITNPYVSNEEIPDRTDYIHPDERTAAKLTGAGVKMAIASFSRAFGPLAPGGDGKWMLIDAAVAGGYGMTDDQILRAITVIPAEILGVSDRVGSLAPGKDGDVIVLDGPPLSIKTWVQRVYINGELVHSRSSN